MAAIDLDASREILDASTDSTVGIEEEFAILDATSLDMVARFEDLKSAGENDDVVADAIAGELIRSGIEIRSGRGEHPHDALTRQRVARRRLFALAAKQGIALGATGTH